ncbi:hypothetical protein [Pedobacter sp. Leaf216]|uniref:hypothetical protein n=1 Tax=Pedobacter sp. Leaf216 TaxID=1735684 RepID=UPI000AB4F977|nr:hypothetical protein [Pedobacter sp. Leaf216]
MGSQKITLYLCLFLMLLTSCSNSSKIIHYQYKGVVITRVNGYPKDYFYYGKFDNTKNLPKDYILSKFSGFDGLMSAFLVFKKDKTVEIIPVADDFTKIGDNASLKLNSEIENIDFIHWRDSTSNNLDSIVEVSDDLKLEIARNKDGRSKVKATYDRSL